MKNNPRNCGQVGFWAVAVSPEQDFIQWGFLGDTEFPFESYEQAETQCKELCTMKEHQNDEFFILNVFPGGQIRVDEFSK